MNLLTADLGNSRCKLRLWKLEDGVEPGLVAALDHESAPGIGARTAAWIATLGRIDGVAMCSVAAAGIERELARVLAETRAEGSDPRFDPSLDLGLDPGLDIACREPSQVGRDRLFAARAALDLCGGSAIVLDAGTALTVDAVRADGTFLGGAIAPGPDLLARALAQGTARLPRVDAGAGAKALGRDTAEALRAGIVVGFRGTAREIAERLAGECAFVDPPLVLTGGARGLLLDPPVFGDRRILEDPDLVHRGLRIAFEARRSARPGTSRVAPRRS